MAKVQIYGEIVSFQEEWAAAEGMCNLTHVNKQLQAAAGEDIDVFINSPGGDPEEGFAIYSSLRRYAKENKSTVSTFAEGRVASAATLVFLAGDRRVASRYIEPFIHDAFYSFVGELKQEDIKEREETLERVNDRIAKFYSEHTNLTYEEAREIMRAETPITPEEALNIRFATEIEEVMRPAALKKRFSTKNKDKKRTTMSDKSEKGLFEALKAFFAGEGPKALEVFTSTSDSLVFPDLEDGQTPAVGDKAQIDGKAAEGRITLQDGTVYVFVAGELTEIVEPEDEDDAGSEEMAALKAENEELKETVSTQAKKIETIEAKQAAFEKQWNGLKSLVSNHKVEEKGNEEKTRKEEKGKTGGLAAAASALKKK